jgi:dienelactone hydrolase
VARASKSSSAGRRRSGIHRAAALAGCAIVVAGLVGGLVAVTNEHKPKPAAQTRTVRHTTQSDAPPQLTTTVRARPRLQPTRPPFAVAERTVRLVDHRRHIRLPDGSVHPRPLITLVRYPAARRGQAAPRLPFPLIVFGHGYTLTPRPYARLLDAWTRAGYVVAAPVFPLENANAPSGPNESDLINQPADMSFVISSLLVLSASRRGVLDHLIDSAKIAVAGHSDGGETALAVAYDFGYKDPRVRAAVILSGAKLPGADGFAFSPQSPPLLAVQGTADDINPQHFTLEFYDAAPPPKYLLRLFGAGHLEPYTTEPQLGVVARVTSAFLDRYLNGVARDLVKLGNVPGVSSLTGNP